MNAGQLREVVHDLRRAADAPATADAELLRRYTAGDEAAFELLVWRHAALVLGVCRRVLHHAQDAEDAFQATWMALARRTRWVGRRGSVAAWLYQVAYRIALRAKARAIRRAGREQPMATPLIDATAADPAAQAGWHELRQVLDEQLGRLPERFRTVFVLRCLAGLSGPEAARALGCPVGTVESRLTRARQRLRAALVRRGFTVPAAIASFDTLASQAPAALVATAVRGATAFITKHVAVPMEAAQLAEGVLRAMLLTRLRNVAAVIVIGLALVGAGIGWYGADAGEPDKGAKDKVSERLQKARPLAELEGEWLLEKSEVGGKVNPDIGWLKNELRWVVRGESITIQRFGQSVMGTIKLDVKKSPREIDLHLVEGPVPGQRIYRGIYKREDVRLTVCYAAPGEPRPTEFATKAGASAMLASFRWSEGRGPNTSGNPRLTYPPTVFVPMKASPLSELKVLSESAVPLSTFFNPKTLTPSVTPGGPVYLAPTDTSPLYQPVMPGGPVYLAPTDTSPLYQLTVPPSMLKPLQGPPFELPKDTPLPKKRVDDSKDA
jgi:RNA polymerase sigma factor (sigma-70 family)